MNRRDALTTMGKVGASGLLAATALLTVQCSPTEAPAAAIDPLADLVRQYEDGLARFNAIPDEAFTPETDDGRLQAETYAPAYDALLNSPPAATTAPGAVYALRAVVNEMSEGGDAAFAISVITAALAYFDGRA